MCGFLSAIIRRDGKIFADGIHGHTELARRFIGNENGIGKQVFWEWQGCPIDFSEKDFNPLRYIEELPTAVADSNERLRKELSKLDGVSKTFNWLAVLRGKTTLPYLPADVRFIVLLDESSVCLVDGMQTVYMYGSSKVEYMYNSSKVESMYNSSKVEYMYDSSKVENMFDSSKVENNETI